jgi:thioredoxin 1
MDDTTQPQSAVVELADSNFENEVDGFPGLVLVDFWADWCTPCHIMKPRVDELAQKYQGNPQVKIASLDVDLNEEIAMRERVMSLPTFKLFKGGQVIDELVGATSAEALEGMITRNLQPAA